MSTKDWTQSQLTAQLSSVAGLDELLRRSESPSGFVRERATLQLGRLGDPLALPPLIVRANDWVPEVRAAAFASLAQLAVPANAMAFVTCLPRFHWLAHCRRAEHAPLIAQVEAFVCRPENARHVLASMSSTVSGVARTCLLLAIKHRLGDVATLVRAGLNHADVAVRIKISPLIAELDGAARRDTLAEALENRCMPVRRAALKVLLSEHDTADYVHYLFDRHSAVRQLVAAQLAAASFDVGAAYRDALMPHATPRRRAIALWGLSEYGRADDAGLITSYLGDPAGQVRRQALAALARRLYGGIRAAVLNALADEDRSVVNDAARIAVRARLQFDAHELQAILDHADGERVLSSLLSAHGVSNKWERVIFLLAMRKRGPAGLERFGESVRRWHANFNRSFVQLSSAQIDALQDALRNQPPYLDATDNDAFKSLLITLKSQGIAIGG